MRFTCLACSKSYPLAPEHLGPANDAKIKCPNCQVVVRVRANADGKLHTQLPDAGAFFVPAESGTAATFLSSADALGDVEIDLPDPNKYEPTKEEYVNPLQKFSVTFCLDKRTKRQRVGVAVVLSMLLIGVLSFGALLYSQGLKRQSLIRDSKTILAVFSLPYNSGVTLDLSREVEEEAAKTGHNDAEARVGTVQTSVLADRLRKVVKAERIKRDSPPTLKLKPSLTDGVANHGIRLTKEQIENLEDLMREAHVFDGHHALHNNHNQVFTSGLRRLCRSKSPSLRICGAKAGAASYTVTFTVDLNGGISDVDALVAGTRDATVSSCAEGVFRRVHYGQQQNKTTFRCEID